ncbi:MAG: hypothetical protein ACUVWP_04115 [bacterium]
MKEVLSKKNRLSFFILIILILFSIYIASLSFFPKPGSLVTLADDAYYYLQISRNIALGNGSTFDEINMTNGYHPLWLFILVPFHFIVGFSRIGAVRMVFILQGLFYFLTVFIIIKGLNERLNLLGFLGIITISSYPRFFRMITCGFESSLVILLMTFLWTCITFYLKDGIKLKCSIILGIILGLLTLARLDVGIVSIVIIVMLIYILFYKDFKSKSILHSLIVFFISVGLFSPFLIWNYVNFGHILTISASMKSSFPKPSLHINYLLLYPEYYIGVILFLFITLIKRRDFKERYYANLVIGLSPIILSLFFILFGKWAHYYHHYSSSMLSIFLISFFIMTKIDEKVSKSLIAKILKSILIIFIIMTIIIFQVYFHNVKARNNFMVASCTAGIWAKENTPVSTIFAIRDCGIFAFFSERRTVNLDGVVNNFKYQEYLRDGRLVVYLKMHGVDYIGQYIANMQEDYKKYTLTYYSYLYDDKYSFVIVEKDDEVLRIPYSFFNNKSNLSLIIWRFD